MKRIIAMLALLPALSFAHATQNGNRVVYEPPTNPSSIRLSQEMKTQQLIQQNRIQNQQRSNFEQTQQRLQRQMNNNQQRTLNSAPGHQRPIGR